MPRLKKHKLPCYKCNNTGKTKWGKCYACHGKGWQTELNGIAHFAAQRKKRMTPHPLPRQYKDDTYDTDEKLVCAMQVSGRVQPLPVWNGERGAGTRSGEQTQSDVGGNLSLFS